MVTKSKLQIRYGETKISKTKIITCRRYSWHSLFAFKSNSAWPFNTRMFQEKLSTACQRITKKLRILSVWWPGASVVELQQPTKTSGSFTRRKRMSYVITKKLKLEKKVMIRCDTRKLTFTSRLPFIPSLTQALCNSSCKECSLRLLSVLRAENFNTLWKVTPNFYLFIFLR